MTHLRRLTRSMARTVIDRISPNLIDDVKLGRFAREWIVPRDCGVEEYYVPNHLLGHAGFDLHVDEQRERVQSWRGEHYQRLFKKLREDSAINMGLWGKTYSTAVANLYYPTPDAEIYAAMILDFRPQEIVEVGSGFSTLIARQAVRHGETGSKLTVIDMEPRTNVSAAADEVIRSFVEDTDLENREWLPNSILFIDSSHICRSRGDLPLLFCKVLPKLPPGMVVHVHDVFLPYEYPTNYDKLCYTEQYLLHCLLSGSPRYRTLLATHYLSRNSANQMQQSLGETVASEPFFLGASYWFRVVA